MDVIDHIVLDFFSANRFEWLTFVMLIITYAASFTTVTIISALSVLSFYIQKHTTRIWPLIITVCGGALTTFLLKNIFERLRPVSAFYIENSYAFPSGHATVAMTLYGFLFYAVWKHDHRFFKKPLLVFWGVLIISVGLSRLYLGEHYLSDVLVGYLVGLTWLIIGIRWHKYLLHWEQFKNRLKNF